jgi:hypothetical protein
VAKTDAPAVKAEPATPTFEYADKTLKEYRNEPKEPGTISLKTI